MKSHHKTAKFTKHTTVFGNYGEMRTKQFGILPNIEQDQNTKRVLLCSNGFIGVLFGGEGSEDGLIQWSDVEGIDGRFASEDIQIDYTTGTYIFGEHIN